ncbi:Lysine-specific histone demethylase 1 [Rhynchospora pubera]|uniref:Lysine-specific histone demethylase 1 n=1 Tax=Rhynchospora pubera TaxID=906938 RepID=A0AAV8FHH8_9POAL|nr:Lysine-specific histone demethylase 1 [Rhynchospora pubera]
MEEPDWTSPPSSPAAAASPSPTLPRRKRRKKQFPGMIPLSRVRILRNPPSSSSSERPQPQPQQALLYDPPPPRSAAIRRRGRPPSSALRLSRDLDVEALIAAAAGFPIDSLTEEEIHDAVIPSLGATAQLSYIAVRNHIVSRWRSDPSLWLTESQALESIRAEHHRLVVVAYSFLLRHGYINFGLAPAILSAPPRQPPSLPAPAVIIIGAGLAGLSAARHLLSLGFKVAVLEGRCRPGGRVYTKRMHSSSAEFPNVTAAVDLGGSVLTGINGNPLAVLARQLGLPLHKVRDICPLYLPDGRPVDSDIDDRMEATYNQILEKVCQLRQTVCDELGAAVDASLGTALEVFGKAHEIATSGEERMLFDWHLANLEYANAALLSDLSMVFWDQDDPYEMGGDHCFIPGGNGRFVHALAENIPIFYGRTVTSVNYGCDGVLVYTNTGQAFRGDMALCTVPLGVLKKGSIHFKPELPVKKQEAIKRLGFGLLNKVALLFPYTFWDSSRDTFGHLTENSNQRGEFFLFYSYTSVAGGPLLIALVAGESAIEFEKTPPKDCVEKCLEVLRKIFTPKGVQVPNPLEAVCTRWGTDRFTHGSYSYVTVGASGDDYDILSESVGDGRLFFAGEATNRRYPATMHGAMLSGFREAANIEKTARKRAQNPSESGNDIEMVDVGDNDLDDLFRVADTSFGGFSVIYDPASPNESSASLVRVQIGGREPDSKSGFLYGLVSRNNVMELAVMDGDEERLSALDRDFGRKLVNRTSLGIEGEALIVRIKEARSRNNRNKEAANEV